MIVGLAGCSHTNNDIIIKNANIIDVQSGIVHYDQDIVIRDRVIKNIDRDINVKGYNQVIEAKDKFVIPGLWDMHVHLEMWGIENMISLMVANGVTGARDMGGDRMDLLDEVREKLGDELPYMRIIRAGKMLDGATENWPFRITVTDSSQAAQAVLDNKAKGVDFIKVHQQLNRESYWAISKTCLAEGIQFVGHVPPGISGIEASEAGQSSIEHLSGTPWCMDEDCEVAEEFLNIYKTNSTYQTPTMVIYQAMLKRYTEGLISDDMKPYLTPTAEKQWDIQDSVNDKYLPPVDQRIEFGQRIVQSTSWLASKMFEMDVPVIAGTDSGIVGVIPGFDLHEELRIFVEEAGASPLQALQSATLAPVRLHHLDSLGAVSPGNYADLLILDRNPLEDINATREIDHVISNGQVIDSGHLDELKEQSKIH